MESPLCGTEVLRNPDYSQQVVLRSEPDELSTSAQGIVTTGLVAVVSVLATLVAVLAWAVLSRRGSVEMAPPRAPLPPEGDVRLDAVLGRLETTLREIGEPRDRVREEPRRTRVLGEIAGTIDFDEVLSRVLEAAGALPGVDAALIRVSGEEEPVIATVGMAPEEVDAATSGSVPASGRPPRAIAVSYDYGTAAAH